MAFRPRQQVVRAAVVVVLMGAASACARSGASSTESSTTSRAHSEPLAVEAPTPTRSEPKALSPLPTMP
jgi:hypothetical protein